MWENTRRSIGSLPEGRGKSSHCKYEQILEGGRNDKFVSLSGGFSVERHLTQASLLA